eukprot:4584562-Amphidinium_carterae.1
MDLASIAAHSFTQLFAIPHSHLSFLCRSTFMRCPSPHVYSLRFHVHTLFHRHSSLGNDGNYMNTAGALSGKLWETSLCAVSSGCLAHLSGNMVRGNTQLLNPITSDPSRSQQHTFARSIPRTRLPTTTTTTRQRQTTVMIAFCVVVLLLPKHLYLQCKKGGRSPHRINDL